MMKTVLSILTFLLESIFTVAIVLFAINIGVDTVQKSFEYGKEISQNATADKPFELVTITIDEDATSIDIAELLFKNDLIANAQLFRLQTRLNGTEDLIYPGTYTLNTQMDSTELIEVLTTAPIWKAENDLRITIREGYTINQIGEYLEGEGIVTKDEFIRACNEGAYSYWFLEDLPKRDNYLEGYLYPETYFIESDWTAEQIVDRLLSQFNTVFTYDYQMRAEELGFTVDQIVTIASIIEKEIQVDSERAKASSVIYNRLNKKMELQMCSTVLYALGKRKDRLLDEDLKIKSPYNTYLSNSNLPIGPIASPGKACIEAALYPDETNYLFFVLKGDDAKEHVFTSDYDDFLNAKAEYNQKF